MLKELRGCLTGELQCSQDFITLFSLRTYNSFLITGNALNPGKDLITILF